MLDLTPFVIAGEEQPFKASGHISVYMLAGWSEHQSSSAGLTRS